MIAEVSPRAKIAECLGELAQQISRRDPPAVQKTSLFASLFKRK